jgi:putative phosphoesterase
MTPSPYLVGIISDTHGLIRREALDALQGSDLIIHAGDIGDPAVVNALAGIAPVHAIRGNNDRGTWASGIPATEVIEHGPHVIYVLHDLARLKIEPAPADVTVVISGHSHKPLVDKRGAVLFVNPGSAGPRRFSLPVTVATMKLHRKKSEATIIRLAAT